MDKKKMIGDIVTSITDKELKKDYFYNAVPLAVILGKDAKEGTLWAAFASYAPGCKMIEVAVICDNTILGSGKKGILFSTEGIYGSMFNKNRKQGPIAMPIKYEELDSARPSPRDKSEVELVFKGGRVEKIYVYTYTGFVITALNRILEELKREKEREKEEKIRKIQQEKQLYTETIYETTKNPSNGIRTSFYGIRFVIDFMEEKECGHRKYKLMEVIEEEDNQISNVLVGWDDREENPVYTTTYFSYTPREGFIDVYRLRDELKMLKLEFAFHYPEQQEAWKTLENDEFMWAIGENYQYVRMEENVEYPIIEVIHSREE